MTESIQDGLAQVRIWSTLDGRLVLDGHSDAAILRYAPGDKVSDADAGALKQAAKPADKARERPADKSGVVIPPELKRR